MLQLLLLLMDLYHMDIYRLIHCRLLQETGVLLTLKILA